MKLKEVAGINGSAGTVSPFIDIKSLYPENTFQVPRPGSIPIHGSTTLPGRKPIISGSVCDSAIYTSL